MVQARLVEADEQSSLVMFRTKRLMYKDYLIYPARRELGQTEKVYVALLIIKLTCRFACNY